MTDTPTQAEDLEAALLTRAKKLAGEYLDNARHNRDQIMADAGNQLRLREEHETLAAGAQAERIFRQRLQAGEIRLQKELDQLRWTLLESVMDELNNRLRQTALDDAAYAPLLRQYLAHAAAAIESDELIAELNARDLQRYGPLWESLCRETAPAKRITLCADPVACSGGVMVYSAERDIRIDNTFEGRIERMRDELQRVVAEHLFATTEKAADG